MKVLVITQVVDQNDPTLGFFHRWIEEFAKSTERVEVICLKKGRYVFPRNVYVHSLGKEHGRPLFGVFTYIARFKWLVWKLRNEYDAVFVHMNPEYLVIAGWFWRLLGKRVALWYTHKQVNLKLRIAVFFAHTVFTASKESFRYKTKKLHIMGHGIDIDFFCPDETVARDGHLLSAGRLMLSKRHDLLIRAAARLNRALAIAGEGPERERLEQLAESLGATVRFLGGMPQEKMRDEYRSASVFLHASETGSLDKVVLEALACGLPVVTTSTALSGLPVERVAANPEAIAGGVQRVEHLQTDELVSYVREHHSLERLVRNIMVLLGRE